jgi:phosphoserine phosphatase RsbU/P
MESPMDAQLVRSLPLFAALPDHVVADIVTTLPQRTYTAGTLLMREGEHGDRFFIILSGEIAIIKAQGSQEERLLGVRGEGDFVGEMSLLNTDGLRSASVQVLRDAQVIELTRADFDVLLHRHPLMAYDMLRVLSTRLRDTHNSTITDLRDKNQQLARAYADLQEQNQRLAQAYADLAAAQEQLIEKEALERELRLAREIQESILPRRLPVAAGSELGARMVPAREVAGDFFDAFPIGDGEIGLVIGDVCGKGMPSAIFMALTRSLLRAEAARAATVEETLRSVNHHLLDMNSSGMFVTVIYGILRPAAREFIYARAGHELPLILDAAGTPQQLPRDNGHPLGLLDDPAIDVQCVSLSAGGTLLLFTDGVTEATGPGGEFFELDRLKTFVGEHVGSTSQQLCDALVERLTVFRGATPQADDITLLAARLR